jgi:hypothetical protein
LCPTTQIDSLRRKSAMHPRQMRQERFFGRTRTIRFRVHPHPDFHRARPSFFGTPALSRVEGSLLGNTEIPGLTPIVLRGRMLLYAPDDCSIVITSVRRSKSKTKTHHPVAVAT